MAQHTRSSDDLILEAENSKGSIILKTGAGVERGRVDAAGNANGILGGVASLSAADSSITVGGSATNPTVAVASGSLPLDVKVYGATGNGRSVGDGAITNATPDLTSATAAFTVADVGKTIVVNGAGAAGVPLVTTIAAYVSGTAVTLTANASTTVSGANTYYGTDDTTALQAALTAAGAVVTASGNGVTVLIPAGIYLFSDLLSVPSRVDLLGMGTYATWLQATAAAAQVRFGDGGGATTATNLGGVSGHFRIWGGNLATNPMFVGVAVARTFENIDINSALVDGLRLEQTQNCAFIEVNVSRCGPTGSGVVLDYGTGGNAFYKCELTLNGYANGRLTHSGAVTGSGYVVNQHNSFDHCIFEGPGLTASQTATFIHEGGTSTTFKDCILSQFSGASGQAALWGTNIPVFQMTKLAAASVSSRVSFIGGCLLNGSAPVAGVVYKGTGIDCLNSPGQSGANVYLGAGTVIQLCDTALKIGDSSTIEADNFVVLSCTTRFAVQAGGVATEAMVVRHQGGHADLTGVDPAYPTLKTHAATAQTANLVENYGTSGLVANLTNSGTQTVTGSTIALRAQLSGRGTAAAPAYTFTNDLDCGMWSPTTNEVAFSTNGVSALRITAAQSVTIGKAVATTATDGFPYIPAAAGAPTGVPTTQAGFVPMYYDTTNHKLWIYDGAWKGVVVA